MGRKNGDIPQGFPMFVMGALLRADAQIRELEAAVRYEPEVATRLRRLRQELLARVIVHEETAGPAEDARYASTGKIKPFAKGGENGQAQ